MTGASVDGLLVEWGERLFYSSKRSADSPEARLRLSVGQRAAVVRDRLRATVVKRAPQVMVKVTGGGRGMAAIAAHFRYIAKGGRLPFEDDRGVVNEGKEALRDLAWQWQHGGSYIGETSHRREAFNIMLSMPNGVDALTVQRAAREFALAELHNHAWVMVLHDHQANPHVHLSVRAENRHGQRLNPRKADLQRWRETFAEKLRGQGIEAEATRQAARGQVRNYEPLWRIKAAEAGRSTIARESSKSSPASERSRQQALEAWANIASGLAASDDPGDRALALSVHRYVRTIPFVRTRGLIDDKAPVRPEITVDRGPSRRFCRPRKARRGDASHRPSLGGAYGCEVRRKRVCAASRDHCDCGVRQPDLPPRLLSQICLSQLTGDPAQRRAYLILEDLPCGFLHRSDLLDGGLSHDKVGLLSDVRDGPVLSLERTFDDARLKGFDVS